MIMWVIYIGIGLILGLLAGIFIGRLEGFSKKERDDLKSQLEQAREELTSHKQQVADHFIKTSTLVNNMTESYRAVYDHLAQGASTLCGDQISRHMLDIPETQLLADVSAKEAQAKQEAKQEAEAATVAQSAEIKDYAPAGDMTEEQLAGEPEKQPEAATTTASETVAEAAREPATETASEETASEAVRESVTEPEKEAEEKQAATEEPKPSEKLAEQKQQPMETPIPSLNIEEEESKHRVMH